MAHTFTIAQTGKIDPKRPIQIIWELPEDSTVDTTNWYINMTGNDVHLQMPKTQGYSIKHKGELDKDKVKEIENSVRQIATCLDDVLHSSESITLNF
jgi:hypothetical protein